MRESFSSSERNTDPIEPTSNSIPMVNINLDHNQAQTQLQKSKPIFESKIQKRNTKIQARSTPMHMMIDNETTRQDAMYDSKVTGDFIASKLRKMRQSDRDVCSRALTRYVLDFEEAIERGTHKPKLTRNYRMPNSLQSNPNSHDQTCNNSSYLMNDANNSDDSDVNTTADDNYVDVNVKTEYIIAEVDV